MSKQLIRLVLSCLTLVSGLYGSFYVVTEVFVSFLPLGIFLVALMVVAIQALRIPPPSQDLVEAVLGKDLPDENVSNGYQMKTVAHRGAGMDAPENSLAAFRLCRDKGCDTIEFDVTLTSDQVPIVFHDETLERMTDLNLVVNKTTWENICNIDISIKHPFKDRFTNTNIPKLDATINQLLSDGQRMFIDIKDNDKQMVNVILALFDVHEELYSRAAVTSFFPNIIYLIRRSNPKIVCALAHRPHAFAYQSYKYPIGKGPKRTDIWFKHCLLEFCDILHNWALPRITYYLLGISVILLHKDLLSPKSVLDWKSKGVRVIVWSVNSPIEKQHISRNLKITYLTDTLTGENSTHGYP